MTLNDLLRRQQIEPKNMLVLRHRPHEPELRKVLPWLAAEKLAVFNAYQQTQGPKLESAMQAMTGHGFVASFIGHEPGKALFVGLYSIGGSKPLTFREYWRVPEYVEMRRLVSRAVPWQSCLAAGTCRYSTQAAPRPASVRNEIDRSCREASVCREGRTAEGSILATSWAPQSIDFAQLA